MSLVRTLANTKLNRKIELQSTWDPNDYVGICYTGIVSEDPRLLRDGMTMELVIEGTQPRACYLVDDVRLELMP